MSESREKSPSFALGTDHLATCPGSGLTAAQLTSLIRLSVCLSVYPSICHFYQSNCLSIYLPTTYLHLLIYLSTCLCLSVTCPSNLATCVSVVHIGMGRLCVYGQSVFHYLSPRTVTTWLLRTALARSSVGALHHQRCLPRPAGKTINRPDISLFGSCFLILCTQSYAFSLTPAAVVPSAHAQHPLPGAPGCTFLGYR